MLLVILKDHWKKILVVLCILGLFATGYFYGRSSVKPEIQVQTVTKVVEKQIEVEKKTQSTDHIVTKITKKDGTTVIKTEDKTHESESTVHETVKEKDKSVTQTPVPPAPKNWKVGLLAEFQPSLQGLEDYKKLEPSYDINVSRRIIWNIWGDAQYNWSKKTIAIGASVEF